MDNWTLAVAYSLVRHSRTDRREGSFVRTSLDRRPRNLGDRSNTVSAIVPQGPQPS